MRKYSSVARPRASKGGRIHRRELLGHPAGADAHHRAPAGEQVDSGQQLRRQNRLPVGDHHHRGEQPHLRRDAREIGHERERLQAFSGEQSGKGELAVRRVGVGRVDARGYHDVVRNREDSVAQLFAMLGEGRDVLRHSQRSAVGYVEAVFHSPNPVRFDECRDMAAWRAATAVLASSQGVRQGSIAAAGCQ